MRELIKCLLVGLSTSLVLAGCVGPGAAPERLHASVLTEAGLQYYWQLPLNLSGGESIKQLIQLDENLYCLTNRRRLIVVDAAVGRPKWSHTVARVRQKVFSPTHVDRMWLPEKVSGLKEILSPDTVVRTAPFDAVLINTVSYVLVLDRADGRVYRKIPFSFAANTGGASDGQNFYVASVKGWYYGIRLQEAVEGWWLSADDAVRAPVKYFARRIYVADEAGKVIATNVEVRGEKEWDQQLSGAVTAEFHVDARGCFLPSDDNRVYAFDSLTGGKLWEQPFACQGPLRDPIQVAESTIFQFARGDKFYAIDLATGQERWSRKDGRTVLAAFDGEVYLLNDSRTLLIVNEILGTVRTSLPMTGWDLFATNVTTPAVYVATRDGKLACIRKIDAGILTPEMLK